MVNPQKAKGSAFELDVVKYLQRVGFTFARRLYGAGRTSDEGDVHDGTPSLVAYECKAAVKHDLSGWMKETEVERLNAGAKYGVLIVKRPRMKVEDSYVIMTLQQWALIRKGLDNNG